MEDFFDQEKTNAYVYLLSDGDNTHKVMISDEHLLVLYRKKRHVYLLKDIKILGTEHIKLLFPLILGGIITPFAILSFSVNLFYPWIHLILIMLGLFLFYVGWLGKFSFSLVFKNGDVLFYYLPSISKNLEAFIDFANTQLTKRTAREAQLAVALFFEVEKKYADDLFGKNTPNYKLFPLLGYTFQQVQQQQMSIFADNLYCINPSKSGREIKFQYDLRTNMMRPTLEGPIPREALINIAENP